MKSVDKQPQKPTENTLEDLSRLVNPNTAGIIWLTDSSLNTNLNGVYEFNYLTNGLLTKSIQSEISTQNKEANFFMTENFGNPFFLSHLVLKSVEDTQKLYNQMELAKPMLTDTINEVFIFNRSSACKDINIIKELTKRFSNTTFKPLNI